MTITEFLLARIAEDEETAQRELAAQAEWREQARGLVGAVVAVPMCMGPDRVLAECEAKRQIVEYAVELDADYPGVSGPSESLIPTLASVYADHPDYREEWRA